MSLINQRKKTKLIALEKQKLKLEIKLKKKQRLKLKTNMRTELEIKEKLQEVTDDLNRYEDLSLANPDSLDYKSDVDFLKHRKVLLEWVLGLR